MMGFRSAAAELCSVLLARVWIQGLCRKRWISRCSSRPACWRWLAPPDRWLPAARRRLAATNGLRGLRVFRVSFIGFSFVVAVVVGKVFRDKKAKRPGCWCNPGRDEQKVCAVQALDRLFFRAPGGAPSMKAARPFLPTALHMAWAATHRWQQGMSTKGRSRFMRLSVRVDRLWALARAEVHRLAQMINRSLSVRK